MIKQLIILALFNYLWVSLVAAKIYSKSIVFNNIMLMIYFFLTKSVRFNYRYMYVCKSIIPNISICTSKRSIPFLNAFFELSYYLSRYVITYINISLLSHVDMFSTYKLRQMTVRNAFVASNTIRSFPCFALLFILHYS